ncbi:glia maturation factor beta [Microstroma glucosiphilum]|uniref:Glia maturation factor beta n=1 Tax=Pseudomicrostroma glucosiphilum TaxID=1684307 RepID=A0A316UH32_9BASI|nr:glia maturation factor beta [Pseudomicrostroma glucosiphilum]PWN23641.1 glia maturation factor beta [Pseudomicrostroma glucosiphilum]
MSSSSTVDIPKSLLEDLAKFRMAKRSSGSAAIVIKVDKKKLLMEMEEQFDDVSLEELEDELPENTPRYILLSYQLSHKDGRVSFPLVLLFWCPETSSVEMSTLYASALSSLSVQSDVGKVVEFREGKVERKVLEQRLGA